MILADATAIFPVIFMLAWFGIAFGAIYHTAKQRAKVKVGSRTYASPEEFMTQFGAELGLFGTRTGGQRVMGVADLTSVHFSGTLEGGIAAQVNYSARAEKGPTYFAHLSVACDEAPALLVTREDFAAKARKLLHLVKEVEVGDPAFDERFLLETQDARAEKALARSELRGEIDRIFERSGVTRLELGNGSLSVTAKMEDLTAEGHRALLALLVRAARTLERVPITVRVLGGERRALRGLTSHARCGYCHEGVTGEEPDLVACDRCATVVHDECWHELGRCPVIGCLGTHAERGPRTEPGRESGTRVPDAPSG